MPKVRVLDKTDMYNIFNSFAFTLKDMSFLRQYIHVLSFFIILHYCFPKAIRGYMKESIRTIFWPCVITLPWNDVTFQKINNRFFSLVDVFTPTDKRLDFLKIDGVVVVSIQTRYYCSIGILVKMHSSWGLHLMCRLRRRRRKESELSLVVHPY